MAGLTLGFITLLLILSILGSLISIKELREFNIARKPNLLPN
jgi:hypothetical protein